MLFNSGDLERARRDNEIIPGTVTCEADYRSVRPGTKLAYEIDYRPVRPDVHPVYPKG